MSWIVPYVLVSTLFFLNLGCRPRSAVVDTSTGRAGETPQDSSRIDTLEVLIQSLKNQLEASQKLSDSEKQALQEQLKRAEEAKVQAEGGSPSPSKPTAPSPTTNPTPSGGASPAAALQGPYVIYYGSDCLQPLDDKNLADGSIYKAMPCNLQSVQEMKLEMNDAGYFRLQHKNSGKCMVLSGQTAGEGTPPIMLPCSATAQIGEQWRLFETAADGNSFKLQSRISNFCLKIGDDGTIFQGNCAKNYTILMMRKIAAS